MHEVTAPTLDLAALLGDGRVVPRSLALTVHVLLVLDSAQQYGLVTGGPVVDVERCEQLLERAGYEFTEDEVDAAIPRVLAALGGVA